MQKGSWPPCAQTCQYVGGLGQSQPLLGRPQLGLSPWAGGRADAWPLQGEYVISKQNLSSPPPLSLHSHSLSCAVVSHSCGPSDPSPGSPKAPLRHKQTGLWWQETSGDYVSVRGHMITSLFVDQRLLSKCQESWFYHSGLLCAMINLPRAFRKQ